MSRLQEIILKARDTLADPDGDRWTDDRLIRLANEAQEDIVKKAGLLRARTTLKLSLGVGVYELPEDFNALDRVQLRYGGNLETLPFISHLEMDRLKDGWEEDTGKPESIVYDKQYKRLIKTYPILDLDSMYNANLDTFGVSSSVSGKDIGTFGLVSSFENVYVTSESLDAYGVISLWEESNNELIVDYLRKPAKLLTLADELDISEDYDIALKYYITGKALRDDMDTQNRAVGNEELSFYERELMEARDDSSKNFTSRTQQYRVRYNGGLND